MRDAPLPQRTPQQRISDANSYAENTPDLYLPTKNGEEAVFFDPNDQNSESDFQEIARHPAIFLDLKKINAGSNT